MIVCICLYYLLHIAAFEREIKNPNNIPRTISKLNKEISEAKEVAAKVHIDMTVKPKYDFIISIHCFSFIVF